MHQLASEPRKFVQRVSYDGSIALGNILKTNVGIEIEFLGRLCGYFINLSSIKADIPSNFFRVTIGYIDQAL